MKQMDDKDKELSKLLKENSYQETSNEWFTRRLLNKLPAKGDNSARHVAWAFYIAAIVVCVGWWTWLLLSSDHTVVTVRDILNVTIASIVTVVLVFVPLVTMLRRS